MLTNAVAPDKLGGLERYVRELAAHLVVAGCEVSVIAKRVSATDPVEEIGADGVQIIRHAVPSKRDPSFALRYPWSVAAAVNGALRGSHGAGILHGHFPVPALVPALRRRRYLYTLHAPVYKELLTERQGSYRLPGPVQQAAVAGLRRAERLVASRAEQVITLSEFMQNEVRVLDAAAGARSRVIAGGVDTTLFSPGSPPGDPRVVGAAPLLFAARRLVPRTGVQQLVQAMPQIRQSFPAARLVVAGAGLQQQAIEDEVRALGLGDCVLLLGRVPQDELIEWYQRADLVVTPTQELEGFGLATAEALACGRPCLVTSIGANPEVVRELSADLVADGSSPDAIAQGVCRLVGSPGRLAELAASARAAVVPKMSWDTIVEEHLELYRRFEAATI
jgi:glycosyltransferase involved in cell wall biosynthesis